MAELDLEAKVKECFEYNKGVNKIYVVEDGTCFLEKAKDHAKNYANSKGLKVEGITRDVEVEVEETEASAELALEDVNAEPVVKEKEVKETSKKETKK